MEEFASVGGSKLLSGNRFRMGFRRDGYAIDVLEIPNAPRILINTSLEFEYGALFTFDRVGDNLLVRVERENNDSTYSFVGYLRERDGMLLVEDDPVANIRLEEYESLFYNIKYEDKYYDIGCGGLSFCNDLDLRGYSAFYFIDE